MFDKNSDYLLVRLQAPLPVLTMAREVGKPIKVYFYTVSLYRS